MIKESFLPLEGHHLARELQELADNANGYEQRVLRAAIDELDRVAALERRLQQAEDALRAPDASAGKLFDAIGAMRDAIRVLEPWTKT